MAEPTTLVNEKVNATLDALRAVLAPDAAWTCGGCDQEVERTEWFGWERLREQVRHLPYSSSVLQVAIHRLIDDGTLELGRRLDLRLAASGEQGEPSDG
jgi:hypothetical protein